MVDRRGLAGLALTVSGLLGPGETAAWEPGAWEPEATGFVPHVRPDGTTGGPSQGTGPVAAGGAVIALSERASPTSAPVPATRFSPQATRRAGAAAGSSLVIGQTRHGELSASDPRLEDDSFFDCYAVQTTEAAAYRVVMRSPTFDTYLSIGTGDCASTPTLSDDDGAGGTDSAISFTGDGQTWFVRANSLLGDTLGAYVVELSEGEGLPRLASGQTLRGELTASDGKLNDHSYFDCYSVETSGGATYRVTMRSPDFDAYLSVGPGQCSGAPVQSDDDSGGGTDSAILFTGDGSTWFVRTNSLKTETTGSYSVELVTPTEGAPAAIDGTKARTRPGPK